MLIRPQALNCAYYLEAQLAVFLKSVADDQYTAVLPVLSGVSIGQHVRHILEFFECLSVQCLLLPEVNYDFRKRDLLLQTSVEAALVKIKEICRWLDGLQKDCALKVSGDLGGCLCTVESSLGRELQYMIEHSVHHFALIKIGVKSSLEGLEIPENFGVAESTLKFKAALVA